MISLLYNSLDKIGKYLYRWKANYWVATAANSSRK